MSAIRLRVGAAPDYCEARFGPHSACYMAARRLRCAETYWIVCPKATSTLPKITIFRKWLLAEAADDMRRLRALSVVRTKAFA